MPIFRNRYILTMTTTTTATTAVNVLFLVLLVLVTSDHGGNSSSSSSIGKVLAWVGNDVANRPLSQSSLTRGRKGQTMNAKTTTSSLFYMSPSDHDNEESGLDDGDIERPMQQQQQQQQEKQKSLLERLAVGGVSVSPDGFHVILKGSIEIQEGRMEERYVPIKVTSDPQDHRAATSAESLTLCQLLSGVDMAGAILPPELLSKIVVYHIEGKLQDYHDDEHGGDDEKDHSVSSPSLESFLQPQEIEVVKAVQKALPEGQTTFKDAHEWVQSRTRLPQVTLDQLTLTYDQGEGDRNSATWKCQLECNLPEMNNIKIVIDDLDAGTLAPLMFHYDPETSLLFACMALALRYKAPIVMKRKEEESNVVGGLDTNEIKEEASIWSTSEDLDNRFPHRTTVSKLQQQSTRVTENIERGFEIHKLTGALQIAMRMGDTKAAEKIRAKLDEYDSLQDLPTTTTARTESDDDDGSPDDPLDDLENNLFQ